MHNADTRERASLCNFRGRQANGFTPKTNYGQRRNFWNSRDQLGRGRASGIFHQACTSPDIGVVALVPVDATECQHLPYDRSSLNLQCLAACDPWMGGPGSAEDNVVFTIKEIG